MNELYKLQATLIEKYETEYETMSLYEVSDLLDKIRRINIELQRRGG